MPGPMMQGMQRGLAAQQPPWQMPQQPQGAPQGQPGQGMPAQWGAQATAALRGMSKGLQQQPWGDPGQGAPVIQNPSAGRSPVAPGQMFQQAAQQYAAQQRPQTMAEDDPRLRGAVR